MANAQLSTYADAMRTFEWEKVVMANGSCYVRRAEPVTYCAQRGGCDMITSTRAPWWTVATVNDNRASSPRAAIGSVLVG